MGMDLTASAETSRDPIATANLHGALRFGAGITVSFVLCEYMQWTPSYLAPLFVAALATKLPGSPPLKVGIVLGRAGRLPHCDAPARYAGGHGRGHIGVTIFLALGALAHHKAEFPAMLWLICIVLVPVYGMVSPAHAGEMPQALVRAMAIGDVTLWCVYVLWPKVVPKAARPAPAQRDFPIKSALAGTLVLLPVVLVYLLFGWTDAMPVLTSTTLLVINLDPKEGATQAVNRTLGALVGGVIGILAFLLLSIKPSLVALALITFIIGLTIGPRIEKAGLRAPAVLQAFNTGIIIFGHAIATPNNSSGLWMTRLFQFTLAGLYAVAVMHLVWGNRPQPGRSPRPSS